MPNERDDAPSPANKPSTKSRQTIAIGAAAMIALATPLVAKWEGKSNDPYRDIIGVSTVCYGETRVAMQRYSDAQCTDMLEAAIGDFGTGVLKRNPQLVNRPYQWAAATSLAYNIGLSAYARSTVSRRFDANRWADGCAAMARWRRAGGHVVKGLVNRRRDEIRLCLTDLK